MVLLGLLLASPPVPPVTPELRAEAPYLACAADEADGSAASTATVQAIQARARTRCEPLLERTVEISLVAVGAAKSRDADEARAQIRKGLREALLTIVENRVSAQRPPATPASRP